MISDGLKRRELARDRFLAAYKVKNGKDFAGTLPEAATWAATDLLVYAEKAKDVGVLPTENEDVRSLRELLIIGLKGGSRAPGPPVSRGKKYSTWTDAACVSFI